LRLRLSTLLLLTLGGCAGAERVYHADRTALYTPALVNYAAQTGEMAVEIKGNPFAQAIEPESIAGALYLPGHFTKARLTTTPGPRAASNVRIVMAFNPVVPGSGEWALCRDLAKVAVRPAAPEFASVASALCAGDRPAAWAHGQGPVGDGPADPRFQRLMGQVFHAMLPPSNPDRGGICFSPLC
jgi:hypothetical protein